MHAIGDVGYDWGVAEAHGCQAAAGPEGGASALRTTDSPMVVGVGTHAALVMATVVLVLATWAAGGWVRLVVALAACSTGWTAVAGSVVSRSAAVPGSAVPRS